MITISSTEFLGYLLLGPIALCVILMALVAMSRMVGRVVNLFATQKDYKRRKKEMEKFLADGNVHEWILIATDLKTNSHVCRKTGWCPALNGFFTKEHIDKIVKDREEAVNFGRFKNSELFIIAKDFGLKTDEINEVHERIISIKKNYTVKKLDNLTNELKSKAQEVEASVRD